jgi:hypothetical protein
VTAAFRPRTTLALAVVGTLSLGVALLLGAKGGAGGEVPSSASDAYSRSAVGHRAFVELLRRTGVPVVVSRHGSGTRAAHATLLVLEPHPDRTDSPDDFGESLGEMLSRARRTLVVLPKRRAVVSPVSNRVRAAPLLPAADPEKVASASDLDARVVRPGVVGGWRGSIPGAPTLPDPQLLEAEGWEPLLACDQGVLVGARGDALVLSDPDLLANHGLGRGENASIALALVDRAREGSLPVVVDETLHGHAAAPSVWSELLRFPLVLVVLQAVLALGVVLWAGVGRFGTPVPAPEALEPGKSLLVSNTAALLRLGRHSAHALDRYLETTLQDAARAVHAPAGLGREATLETLARVGEARGARDGPRALEDAVRAVRAERRPGPRALAVARRVHAWRERVTEGRA